MSLANRFAAQAWIGSTLAFLMVGLAAAATHLLAFKIALSSLAPELANGVGFLAAFWVSFFGHRLASFRDTQTGVGESLLKFALTALAGFVTNELVFVLVHRVGAGSAWLALFAGMVAAAVQTYCLSRFWAFKR